MAQDTLSPLGRAPDWSRLDAYQQTITREAFLRALKGIYSIDNAYARSIRVMPTHALIRTGETGEKAHYKLAFATRENGKPVTRRFWTPADELSPASSAKPLQGLHIALDPGHLGGKWARMEERWYVHGAGRPVQEGDMTLAVAKLLAPRLEKMGARVSLIRNSSKPATKKRPKDFAALARRDLAMMGIADPRPSYSPMDPPQSRWETLQWHQEKIFYRTSEIRARAEQVNLRLQPDLVVCLHLNAEPWGDPNQPVFVERNHLHVLVNGAYSADELARHDERFEMIFRLLQRIHDEEIAIAETVAAKMARVTQLPAYVYTKPVVKRVSGNPYVYARNLLANRLYECPVIYLEPYVMNHPVVFERVQAGAYRGTQHVAGRVRPNLYEEYARGVLEGILAYYQDARRQGSR